MADLKSVLQEFESRHDRVKELQAELKEAQSAYDEYRYEVVLDALYDAGILDEWGKGSCSTPSGRKLYITTDTRAYIRKEDEEVAHGALREMGFDELIRETVHPSTLTAWIRDRLANGESIPPGVQMYEKDKAVLRKS